MDFKIYSLFLTIIVITDFHKSDAYDPLSIKISPSGRVKSGRDVKIECAIDRSTSPSGTIVWRERQGSVHLDVAHDGYLENRFRENSRYRLSSDTRGGQYTETLAISNARFEDSGTYECTLYYQEVSTATQVHQTLVVCDDTGSESCKCSEHKGWATPQCFDEPPEAQKVIDQYKGAVIGLVICLIIVIVYAVVVTVYLYRDVVKTLKLRAEKKLEERRERQNRSTSGADDTRHLDLTDNTSMISGSHYGHAGAAATQAYHDNSLEYHDNSTDFLDHSREYHDNRRIYRGDPRDYGKHRNGYSPHDGGGAEGSYSNNYTVRGEVHSNLAYEPDQAAGDGVLPRYNELTPDVVHPHSSKSPIYKNPPTSKAYAASASQNRTHSGQNPNHAGHNLNQSADSDVSRHQGVRPKNSAPGRSAFTPVYMKDVNNDGTPRSGDRLDTSRGSDGSTPRGVDSNVKSRDRQMTSGDMQSPRGNTTDVSTHSTPGGYGPYPSQYATYDGGLNNASGGDGFGLQHPHGRTPQSTRSERQGPTSNDIHVQERGAYSEAPKEQQRNGYGPHGYPAQDRNNLEPKRLDFNTNGHAVTFGDGPHVGQKDTVI